PTTQDEVTRLGGNYGTCTKDGDDVAVKLIYNSTYTQQACLHSCFQRKMIEDCGCGYYYYPLPPGTEYCNYNKHPNWGKKKPHTHVFKCVQNDLIWPMAQCLYVACFRKDIAKVNIYYERLNYNSWDESPEYTMMSNMGSNWSLWFGSSVLSVVELLEFLVDAAILSLIFLYRQFTAKRTWSPGKQGFPPRDLGSDLQRVPLMREVSERSLAQANTDDYFLTGSLIDLKTPFPPSCYLFHGILFRDD
uniref:Uncharacterized protein n=1 Tax=Podarcis muralis TaxID=64176 RepID=A0A670JAM8_PODMU